MKMSSLVLRKMGKLTNIYFFVKLREAYTTGLSSDQNLTILILK